jgi:Protein of unknown function (DUF 659)
MSSPDLVPASPLSSIDEAPVLAHLDLTVDELDGDILPLANDDAVSEIADLASGNRERGRVSSTVWDFFTSDADQQHANITMCKNYKALVNHDKKSESVKVHLHKCAAFWRCMNGMEIAERPDWYSGNKCGKKDTTSTAPASLLKSVSASRQRSIKAFALAKLTPREKRVSQKRMAMHYFATGTSFQRIVDPH